MRLLLCKFCEYAVQNANGRQSLIGLFDNVVAPFFPFEHPPFFLCTQVEFDPGEAGLEFEIVATLIDEDGHPVAELRTDGQVPEAGIGIVRLFTQFLMPPVTFQVPGFYRLDVSCNGDRIGEERLPVLQVEAPS